MNIIKFSFSKEQGTTSQKRIQDDTNLELLAATLREGESYLLNAKKLLYQPDAYEYGGNLMRIYFGKNNVTIVDQLDENEGLDYSFQMPKKDLDRIIEQYLEIIKNQPNEFYLKQYDDGKITIELEP